MVFQDTSYRVVDFASGWRDRIVENGKDFSVQTSEICYKDRGCQSYSTASVEVQTGSNAAMGKEEKYEDEGKKRETDTKDTDLASLAPEDMPSLTNFMHEQLPVIEHAMSSISTSRMLDDLHQVDHESATEDEAKNWELLEIIKGGKQPDDSTLLSCTGLDWNATGSQLAACFGRYDTYGWCDHHGRVLVWNIFGRTSLSVRTNTENSEIVTRPPDQVLEVGSGVMCVSFHPIEPATIVIGTFNGEIQLWDFSSSDEPIQTTSPIEDYCHREPVVKVEWVRSTKWKNWRVASTSAEGKVLIWDTDNRNLRAPCLGCTIGSAKQEVGSKLLGCTTFAFLKSNNVLGNTFVVGSEGGIVGRCQLQQFKDNADKSDANTSLKWTPGALSLVMHSKDPGSIKGTATNTTTQRSVESFASKSGLREVSVESIFKSRQAIQSLYPDATAFRHKEHCGPVYGIDTSPFHRNLFATCGVDGTARVYSLLQHKPELVLSQSAASCSLFDIKWSPSRATVFACVSSEGNLIVYNLAGGIDAPLVIPSGKEEKNSALSLSFNRAIRGIIATGDSAGNVRIFKLPGSVVNRNSGDQAVLTEFT